MTAPGTSIYAQALVWTAVEEGIVLVVPSTALGTGDAARYSVVDGVEIEPLP